MLPERRDQTPAVGAGEGVEFIVAVEQMGDQAFGKDNLAAGEFLMDS